MDEPLRDTPPPAKVFEPERLLFHAGEVLAYDKPHDLPTSGRTLDDPDCLQHHLMQHFRGKVWAVHQLDADTTGVNLFTTNKRLVEPLKRALAGGTKQYLAIVHGPPSWECHTCRAPIGETSPGNLGVHEEGRSAVSHFQVVARTDDFAALRVEIETGRTHQIRIHAAHLGHSLVGEEWYRRTACRLHPRQALHAVRVRWEPSEDREAFEVNAPLAPDLGQLLRRLGLAVYS